MCLSVVEYYPYYVYRPGICTVCEKLLKRICTVCRNLMDICTDIASCSLGYTHCLFQCCCCMRFLYAPVYVLQQYTCTVYMQFHMVHFNKNNCISCNVYSHIYVGMAQGISFSLYIDIGFHGSQRQSFAKSAMF